MAASTFGVLMIHANSDMMRQWLWKDLLYNADMYNSNYFVLHMFGCTIGIFVVCTLIDMVRIRWIFLCDEIALPEIWKSDVRKVEII